MIKQSLLKKWLPVLLAFAMLLSGLAPTIGTNGSFSLTERVVQAAPAPLTPTVNIGDYLQFGKYYDQPILWRVIHKDPTTGNPILWSDRILSFKSFDASGGYHSDTNRASGGSNYYPDSNIRQWLNSSSANEGTDVIDWIQNDPSAANVQSGRNPYSTEKGFLADGNFTSLERGMIQPLTHRVVLDEIDASKKDGGTEGHLFNQDLADVVQNYDTSAYYKNVSDSVFLLSVKQLKEYVYDNRAVLGDDYHLAKPTVAAVDKSTYKTYTISNSKPYHYWLSTPDVEKTSLDVRSVSSEGIIYFNGATNSLRGVRPAIQLNLNNTTLSSGTGSFVEPYSIASVNLGPTDIQLSSNTVSENIVVRHKVTTINAIDTNIGDQATFTLVSGSGDTDNANFVIEGNSLKSIVPLNYETKSSHNIRLRVTDGGGLFFEKSFVISVTDMVEFITTGNATKFYGADAGVVDPNLTINGSQAPLTPSTTITGASVMISSQFDAGKDTLSYTGALPSGVTGGTFNSTTGTMIFGGSTTAANWQALLRTVRFSTTSNKNVAREVTFTIGQALPLVQANGLNNYYEHVANSTSWTSAKSAAEARKTAGITNGYLAVVDSKIKNDFLKLQFAKSGWTAGTDEFSAINSAVASNLFANQTATEGKYYWIAGANKGSLISTNNDPNVKVPAGQYANWRSGEPNNANNSEHYLELTTDGWNDLANGNNREYFVEYSGATTSLSTTIRLVDGAPTDIALAATAFGDSLNSGGIASTFVISDPLPTDSFRVELINGTGDTDNTKFIMDSNVLRLNQKVDASAQSTFNIRVRVTDTNNLSLEKALTIQATNVTEYVNASKGVLALTTSSPTVIDPDIVVNGNQAPWNGSNSITGASVLIGNNFDAGKDSLSFTGSLPTGVTVSTYNTNTGLLRFNGSTTAANWQSIFRQVKYGSTSTNPAFRSIYFTVGNALPFQTSNGTVNYYEFVSGNTNWANAKTQAENRQLVSVINGHLMTSNEKAENDFIKRHFNNSGWLGGTDEASVINAATGTTTYANQTAAEGRYHWIGGAENGILFTAGNTPNTVVQNGQYNAWRSGEPNNWSNSEHYLEYFDGGWNDLTGGTNRDYYVEYNGASKALSTSILVRVNTAPTNIQLSVNTVEETATIGTAIGALSSTDQDPLESANYSLPSGQLDNSLFAIVGTSLKTAALYDYEIKPSYTVRVRVTDIGGATFDKDFTIQLTNVNEPATDIIVKKRVALQLGDYVQYGSYDNKPIIWRVIKTDSDGNPILFSDKIITRKAFDAKGSYHTQQDSPSFGSNYYPDSNLRQWLNSDSMNSGTDLIDWIQNDPTSENLSSVFLGTGGYATEKGFLADGNFTATERTMIKPLTHKTLLSFVDVDKKDGGSQLYSLNDQWVPIGDVISGLGTLTSCAVCNYDSAYYKNVTDKVFLLSVKQYKEWLRDQSNTVLGNYWVTNNDNGVANSTVFWLNTPGSGSGHMVRQYSGFQTNVADAYTSGGVRPAIQLDINKVTLLSGGTGALTQPFVVRATPLDQITIAENSDVDQMVGDVVSIDVDQGDSYYTSIVSGAGSTDNLTFRIDTNALTVQQVLNYEAKSSYSVRLRVTDSGGLSHEKVIPIAVEDVNEAPTTIGLSNSSVSESAASGSTVGTLTTADEDAKETATFTLVSGTGSTDNGNFTIDGTTLKTATTLVYATKSSHSIRVRVTDKGGLTYEKQFTIQVTEVGANTAPTDISLSASSLAENAGANADVGTLSATDADAGDTATFTLVSGSGSTDNAAFNISGTSLRANTSFDFETKSSYSVRVRVTDSGDATYEKTFAISVLDIDDTAPIAPTGLASSLVTATSATVSWTESTDNVGVTGYEVYNGATLAGTTTGATTFNLTGLASGSTNSITVVAIDVANNKSASSTILTVNLTDILPPSVPSGLTSSNVTQSGFTVTWTASTDNRAVKSYNVYRNGAYVTNVSTNSYKLSGLTALTSYSIRVLAIDAAGNRSPQSAAFTATTSAPADVVVPSTPSGLTATSVLSNRLLLTWTPSIDNVGVTGYNVYVNNVYLKTVTAAQTDLTGLTPLTTYSIQVQALDALKNRSARSTALSVTTLAPPDTTVPTAPTNLTSSNLTGASVTVRWDGSTDNVGVTGYNVYVNGVYNKTTTTRATTITGLSNMTTYAITVLAFDAAKNRSVLSSAISITTLDSTAPTAPTNVASSNVTKTSVRVTWTTATDNVAVTNYNIYRNGAYVATVSGTATSYNLTGLAAGTTYNITVRALDAAKNFTNSTVLSVTTLP